ncbi:Kaptin [Fasciola gigantica]|uniref:Kaptin n=1 Tax=Fasciola gigantica TaxID=46835 RepID=A0A504Y4N0_FASGI|nr:Kaptin [Fasciola gigantica]
MKSLLPSEVFYFASQAQSNIYNLTYVKSEIKETDAQSVPSHYDIMVAYYRPASDTSTNKQYCLLHRFSSDGDMIKTVTKNMDFVYIPGASDIVCIDALFDEVNKEYIFGDGDKGYLNIYGESSLDKLPGMLSSSWTCDPVFKITNFSECCLSFFSLSYVPLQLTHTYYISPTTSKLQWAFILSSGNPFADPLLSGSVRVFAQLSDTGKGVQEDECKKSKDTLSVGSRPRQRLNPSESINTIYGELGTEAAHSLFPELATIPGVKILHMDFHVTSEHRPFRLAAFGAQDGWIGVVQTDMEKLTVLHQFSFSHESPITNVRLFNQFPSAQVSSRSGARLKSECFFRKCRSTYKLHCLYLLFISRILEHEYLSLDNQIVLPLSADFDHVNCASVGDFNFDGLPEIVLGTFGQRLLFYQWDSNKPVDEDACLSLDGGYRLVAQKSLIGPVHCISPPLDLVGDGLDAMVVLSGRGLHVYQHDVDDILEVIRKRIGSSKPI